MKLHAEDPMGKAAHKAAMLVTRQDLRLHIARSAGFTAAERKEALVQFARQHRAFCRAIAELEQHAPNAFREGYEEDARGQDFIEGRKVGEARRP
jgi:hypothetical protein